MNRTAASLLMLALVSSGAASVAVLSAQTAAAPATPAQGTAAAARGPQGPPRPQPQVARVTDLMQMMAALPDTAPATPKQPRRVLVLAKAAGFVHSSIPLAARTIEAMGQKTGAWTTVISYDPAVVTAENLQQYDAIFLASTTGTYLDDPASAETTAARRKAFMDFIRGGKGLGGDSRRHRLVPRQPAGRGARRRPPRPARRAAAGRRRAAVARVQQDDQRLLQVALALPDADRREDRRSGQPDQRGRSAASTRRRARARRRGRSRSSTRSTRSTRRRTCAAGRTSSPASTTRRCRPR